MRHSRQDLPIADPPQLDRLFPLSYRDISVTVPGFVASPSGTAQALFNRLP